MKILIIEGIVTSGKTSLIENISNLLGNDKVKVYGEAQTHEPIMDKTDELHIEFFKSLLEDASWTDAVLIIFDRFHFTQAQRAKASVNEYSEIEDMLAKQNTLVVYLKVDESAIADRIRLAVEHRDKVPNENFQWGEYFQTKGETFEEIAKHYAVQQRNQLQLLEGSKLENQIYDTTNHDYLAIAEQIVNGRFNKA